MGDCGGLQVSLFKNCFIWGRGVSFHCGFWDETQVFHDKHLHSHCVGLDSVFAKICSNLLIGCLLMEAEVGFTFLGVFAGTTPCLFSSDAA